MDRVALDFGYIQVYWYSIFILLAVLVASLVIYKEMKKQGITTEEFTDLLFNTVICGIIGARIYYVIFNMSYYIKNIVEILEIWNGGLAIHGGLIGGLLYVMHFCKKRKINTLKLIDMLVVGVIIGQAVGRWGNFFNQEAFGPVTTYQALKQNFIPQFIINGMKILGEYHEPTFYYESLWNVNGFLILYLARHYKKLKVGQLTGIYLAWYSLGRIYIEYLRMDSLLIGHLKVAQIVSILLILGGIYLIIRHKITKKEQPYHDINNTRTEVKDKYETFEAYKHETR